MVSLSIGRLRTKRFKKARNVKENDPASKRNIEENLAQSSDESTDESMGSSDENDVDNGEPIAHLIGSTDSSDNFIYKPINRRLGLVRKSSTHGSFKVSESVREVIKRRTSGQYTSARSSNTRDRGVSFLDEELGLTPRHVVTDTYFRPRTSTEEKKVMFYSSKDFTLFEREQMYEAVEAQIKAIERQSGKNQEGEVSSDDEDLEKEPLDLEQVQKLVQKARNRLNLEHTQKKTMQ